jgi:hypothetical protein
MICCIIDDKLNRRYLKLLLINYKFIYDEEINF